MVHKGKFHYGEAWKSCVCINVPQFACLIAIYYYCIYVNLCQNMTKRYYVVEFKVKIFDEGSIMTLYVMAMNNDWPEQTISGPAICGSKLSHTWVICAGKNMQLPGVAFYNYTADNIIFNNYFVMTITYYLRPLYCKFSTSLVLCE